MHSVYIYNQFNYTLLFSYDSFIHLCNSSCISSFYLVVLFEAWVASYFLLTSQVLPLLQINGIAHVYILRRQNRSGATLVKEDIKSNSSQVPSWVELHRNISSQSSINHCKWRVWNTTMKYKWVKVCHYVHGEEKRVRGDADTCFKQTPLINVGSFTTMPSGYCLYRSAEE